LVVAGCCFGGGAELGVDSYCAAQGCGEGALEAGGCGAGGAVAEGGFVAGGEEGGPGGGR
jgi:hypothetical protein